MSNMPVLSPRGRRFLLWLLICGFAICNFVCLPWLVDLMWAGASAAPSLFGIFIGSVAGQGCLLAVWGVLGPLRAPARLIATSTIGAFLMVSVMGFRIVDLPGEMRVEELAPLLFLPLILLAFQAPLWGLKLMTGGRIAHVGANPRQSITPRRQFGLRDVMVATVVIAVALSLTNSGVRMSEGQEAEGWIPLLVFCLVCAVVSTFTTLPCLWAGMIARNKKTAAGIIAIYTLLMSVLCVVVIGLLPPRRTMPWSDLMLFFAFVGTLMVVVLGTLHLARLCGYTFIGWRRPQPVLPSDCPFALQDDSPGGTQPAEIPAPHADEPLDPDQPLA